MRLLLLSAGIILNCALAASAELMLFAKYDWQNGAKDVSGSPLVHDGVVEEGASVSAGKLLVDRWDGVNLNTLPELNGASQVLLRFEDVTFDSHGDPAGGPVCHAPILMGYSMTWSAGVFFDLEPQQRSQITFFVSSGMDTAGMSAVVADAVVNHFDSIEYRFDGTAPLAERLAVRWNDGPWVFGASEKVSSFPISEYVRINNGGPADEDPMWGSMGAVSLYSNQIPEPGAAWLSLGLIFALGRRRSCQPSRKMT